MRSRCAEHESQPRRPRLLHLLRDLQRVPRRRAIYFGRRFLDVAQGSLHDAALRRDGGGTVHALVSQSGGRLGSASVGARAGGSRVVDARSMTCSSAAARGSTGTPTGSRPAEPASSCTRTTLCDEYFVPIAVKCIGDPDGFLARLGDRMSADGVPPVRRSSASTSRVTSPFVDTQRRRAALAAATGSHSR